MKDLDANIQRPGQFRNGTKCLVSRTRTNLNGKEPAPDMQAAAPWPTSPQCQIRAMGFVDV